MTLKKLLIVLPLICLAGCKSRPDKSNVLHQSYASFLTVDSIVHDFGTIKESDGVVSHRFVVMNTGTEKCVIDDVVSGCGCMAAYCSSRPFRKGDTAVVTVAYNPEGRSGAFRKRVMIFADGGKHYLMTEIMGQVE